MKRQITADQFNAQVPVGTRVKFHPIIGRPDYIYTTTRSEAWDMCGAVIVKVEGRAGGVDVEAIEMIEEQA
ncbi:hypothetical protein [Methylophilus sp. YYY-1]|uniref:hypothetical protein n=1 Tax=Methylophilus sp. YYY-1 TaxID=2682087 RepID=UPI0023B297F9|nr:hypothetical protein [Methylophilus sp. YYY-1]MDF0377658.1 hypothetical protein [Methylophilus sp. YYY-1]